MLVPPGTATGGLVGAGEGLSRTLLKSARGGAADSATGEEGDAAAMGGEEGDAAAMGASSRLLQQPLRLQGLYLPIGVRGGPQRSRRRRPLFRLRPFALMLTADRPS